MAGQYYLNTNQLETFAPNSPILTFRPHDSGSLQEDWCKHLQQYPRYSFSKEKIAIVMWDGAPAHRAKLEIPEGIKLFQTPAHTPEMNPSERLWSPLRSVVANQTFEGIEKMEDVLIDEMRDLSKRKEHLSGMTNYHRLPST